MIREKSSSITQLVKTVAKEQAMKAIGDYTVSEFANLKIRISILENAVHIEKPEDRSFANANTSWHPFEQNRLEQEVCKFIHEIACSHRRSNRALSIRLRELFEAGFEYS